MIKLKKKNSQVTKKLKKKKYLGQLLQPTMDCVLLQCSIFFIFLISHLASYHVFIISNIIFMINWASVLQNQTIIVAENNKKKIKTRFDKKKKDSRELSTKIKKRRELYELYRRAFVFKHHRARKPSSWWFYWYHGRPHPEHGGYRMIHKNSSF